MADPIPIDRVIQVFVVFMGSGIVLFVIALLILKRSRSNLHVAFSGFFICIFVGAIINVIYALLTTQVEESIVVNLHLTTYSLFCMAHLFLFIFNLLLLKSNQVITKPKQILMILLYTALISVFFFIPDGAHINAQTYYRPQWSLTMYIYAILISLMVMIPTIITATNIYKKLEEVELRKRWIYSLIGIIIIQIEHIGVSTMIFLNNPLLRQWWNIFDLIAIAGNILTYYGVGRQLIGKTN